MSDLTISFRPMQESDLILLHQWFQEPIVRQYYAKNKTFSQNDINKKYMPRLHGDEDIPSFIAFLDEVSIGFIQYYCLQDYLPSGVSDKENELFKQVDASMSCGIDLFIANEHLRGKKIGQAIIQLFVKRPLPAKFTTAIVDPLSKNHRAIACYQACGFKQTYFSELSEHVIMKKDLYGD